MKVASKAILDVLRIMKEHILSTFDIMGIMVAIDKMKTEEKKSKKL